MKNPSTSLAEKFNDMKVPGSTRDREDPEGGKWGTIRYAIDGWGTTVRLVAVVVAISAPAYLIVWLAH